MPGDVWILVSLVSMILCLEWTCVLCNVCLTVKGFLSSIKYVSMELWRYLSIYCPFSQRCWGMNPQDREAVMGLTQYFDIQVKQSPTVQLSDCSYRWDQEAWGWGVHDFTAEAQVAWSSIPEESEQLPQTNKHQLATPKPTASMFLTYAITPLSSVCSFKKGELHPNPESPEAKGHT